MIGAGPEEALVRTSERVRLLGWQDRACVHESMAKAAFLVMPSVSYETFGLVTVEAFACGLPVIASSHGAMAELVEHHRTGLLVEPGSVAALAEAIGYAESNPDRMAEMGMQARKVYEERYTSAVNYKQLMVVYDEAKSQLATR